MSIGEMQSFMARLYLDDCFRKLFCLDPNPLFADYRLSEKEIRALRLLDLRAINHFAKTLKAKLAGTLLKPYPLLDNTLPQSVMDHYLTRFWQTCRFRPYESLGDYAVAFGYFMEQSLAGSEVPGWYADLARFERCHHMITTSAGSAHGPDQVQDLSWDDQITSATTVLIEHFEYDMISMVASLREDREPIVEPVPCILLFSHIRQEPKVFEIDRSLADLIGFASGSPSVETLFSVLTNTTTVDRPEFLDILKNLLEQGIVYRLPAIHKEPAHV